jgi:threonine aldolase
MDPATNMVFVAMDDTVPGTAEDLSERLEANGVLAGITGGRQFRLVAHYWISDMDVEETVQVFRDAIRQ